MNSRADRGHPVRRSVRLILLNEISELLLMRIALPDRVLWCTIGGGIEPGETPELAARREAREEIGFTEKDIAWGPSIWYGEHILLLHNIPTIHKETFILARTNRKDLCTDCMTAEEKRVVKEFKWWSLDELKRTEEFIVPPSMVRHLGSIIARELPKETLVIDLGDGNRKPAVSKPGHPED